MEEWKQRLKSARVEKGLNKTEFAKAVGVSNPTVTDWEKSVGDGGIKELSGLNLTKVCQVLNIEPAWLLHGEQRATAVAEDTLRALGAQRIGTAEQEPNGLVPIPMVELRLSAGITGFEVEPDRFNGTAIWVSQDWIDRNGYIREKLVVVRIRGESMIPTLYPEDRAMINLADTKPVDSRVYAVNYEGEAVIKRLSRDAGQWWLTSDNPDQRMYGRKLCRGAGCIIVGRVVLRESENF